MKKVLFIFCIAIGLNCNARKTAIDGIYYTLFDNYSTAQVEKSFYGEDGYYRGNITIPSYVTYYSDTYKVTEISIGAFQNCGGLRRITIPNSVSRIGNNAFSYCTGLETVIIESANEQLQIKKNAFEKCPNLKSITCEAKIPPLCENLGIDVDKVILYVPKESVGLYESSKEYWPYIKKIEGK